MAMEDYYGKYPVNAPSAMIGYEGYTPDYLAPGGSDYQAPELYDVDSGANLMNEGKTGGANYGGYLDMAKSFLGGGGKSNTKAGSVANLLDQGGNAAIMSGNPIAMGVGTAAKVAATGLNVYDAFQSEEQARKNYEQALRDWEDDRRRELEDEQREERRRERQEGYYGAKYSASLEDRFADAYSGTRQPGAR